LTVLSFEDSVRVSLNKCSSTVVRFLRGNNVETIQVGIRGFCQQTTLQAIASPLLFTTLMLVSIPYKNNGINAISYHLPQVIIHMAYDLQG
jgi:hypothetical protein